MGAHCIFLLLALWASQCAAVGNVGCLFSEQLCTEDIEWCFDDGAFGKCMSVSENQEDLFRHPLDEEELAILEGELKKLLERGYEWNHRHTQCLLQAVLYAFKTGRPLDGSMCEQYKISALEENLSNVIPGDEEFDPANLAFIRFTPSAGNHPSDFADEIYVPPNEEEEGDDLVRAPSPHIVNEFQQIARRSLETHFSPAYNSPDNFRSGFEVRDFIPLQEEEPEEERDKMDDRPFAALRSLASLPSLDDQESRPRDIEGFDAEKMSKALRNLLKPSFLLFKTPTQPKDDEDRDDIKYEVENEEGRFMQFADDGRGYTEGGTVYQSDDDSLPELIDKLNGALGFKRRERLDVKKPGPPYDPAFQERKPSGDKPTNKSQGEKENIENGIPQKPENGQEWPPKITAFKKMATPTKVTSTPDYDMIDMDVVFIQFDEIIKVWNDAERIMNTVAKLLHIPPSAFSHLDLNHNEMSFKVDREKAGLNASQVATKIGDIKEQIRNEFGVVVISTGIGSKTAKLAVPLRMVGTSDHEVYVVVVVVVGVLVALALSAAVLYLTRKHGHKLRAHVKSEGEPMSKLYQDLCRARMSTKTSQQESAPAQRVTSLSKESDKDSPPSRSSTSSWSEEPALTNMDLTTGQMVLSYMEEHLKNKERLESEWTALCSYEADPSATTIAQRAENLQKNRYPHALPYDHARVVLNELSNITGSDYINASTITDHDPRNPAYIVTQGPLPHTAPDLWQMVWEQGCVAMVMLTRLGETESPLCYHYWPDEGSEMYHVYEVHLVSEHIWCDDYLVRSFYLKNLKTGETRTVTQFHFMSWPDGGIPSATKPLLEFRRKVNKSFRGRSCPIVVHCSDGVGRSGSYVLLDMVLNRIAKGAKEIDVAATLEHIRDQRAGAVATKQQFQFVLQAVADEVQAILKLLPQQP